MARRLQHDLGRDLSRTIASIRTVCERVPFQSGGGSALVKNVAVRRSESAGNDELPVEWNLVSVTIEEEVNTNEEKGEGNEKAESNRGCIAFAPLAKQEDTQQETL